MKADTVVKLVNKDSKKFEGVWDSKTIEIAKGKHIEVVKGLADHFIEVNPNHKLEIEEIEVAPLEPKEVVNPLEDNNRGKAFEELD